MRFSRREIDSAKDLKSLGLPWEPAVGHYIYDETGTLQQSSPFQRHIYFILNYYCFLQRVGGVRQFKELMTWLPAWHDARQVLRSFEVSNTHVHRELLRNGSVEKGLELLAIYRMIKECLRRRVR